MRTAVTRAWSSSSLAAGAPAEARSRAEGDLPRFALVTGAADPMECLLLKPGIAPSEFTTPDAGGRGDLRCLEAGEVCDSGPCLCLP